MRIAGCPDVRVIPIFAGSTEVMKVIVGRMMGL